MNLSIECDTHGSQKAAAVCAHILETLQDETRRGFCLATNEEGDFQALCTNCGETDLEEWLRVRDDLHVMICFQCFRRAAELNNLELPVQ